MGRPRKPTAKHKAEGTFKPSRHGGRADEVSCGGPIGSPTSGVKGEGLAVWRSIVDCLPENTLQALDESALESLCRWLIQWRRCMASLEQLEPTDEIYPKLIRAADAAHKNFMILASRFGLTPADRAKLKVGGGEDSKEEDNPFAILRAYEAQEEAM